MQCTFSSFILIQGVLSEELTDSEHVDKSKSIALSAVSLPCAAESSAPAGITSPGCLSRPRALDFVRSQIIVRFERIKFHSR